MRPVIEQLRARGHEVEVTARDFAQTLRLCERFGIEHTAIGRHRGAGLVDKARGLAARSLRAASAGRAAAASTSRSVTAPTTSRSPRRFCEFPPRPRSTTSGRRSSTPSTAGWPRPWWCPTRSRPSACTATAHAASCTRYPGLKEEYYLADFEPDPAVLSELGLDRDAPIAVVRTPPAVSLYHRFENDLFGQVLRAAARLAGGRPAADAGAARTSSCAPAGSSSPSARSTPSR